MATAVQRALDFGPAAGGVPVVRASAFEAGTTGRRTIGWRAPTVSPNGMLSQLATLRDRSREAVRNNGYAKGVIDKLVKNIVGTGVKPLSQASDAEFRRAAQALWARWTDYSDADGLLDWYGQQAQAVRCWLEAGEVFLRLRLRTPDDGLPVALQVQVLEPEMCPYTYNSQKPNGNRIRAGIEFDRVGRRVAYWFHPSRPGDLNDWEPGDLRAVPAESVIHMYDPLRPGQLRGLPHLAQALIRLRELDKFDDATLLKQQLQNLFVAFLKRGGGDLGTDVHPLTGQAADGTSADRPVLELQPGIFQELEPGEEVEFSEPPDAGQNYVAFMRQQLYSVSASTGVPYQVLTGDMTGVNDRLVRVILHEFRRGIQAWQHQIVGFQLCYRVWQAWMDRVFLSGALPIPFSYLEDPEPWAAVRWMPQGWPYIHPVQDVDAAKAAIRAGFTTRSAVVSEQGEDAEAIDAEQAADNERADELGLRYDSDGRTSANASTGAAGAPTTAKSDPDEDEEADSKAKPEEVPA